MKNNKYIIVLLAVFTLIGIYSCQEDNYEFGSIVAPSNITVTAEIIGKDVDNPNGDGSGKVNFIVKADNALSYTMHFGNRQQGVTPSGRFSTVYAKTGVHTYTAVATAVGSGGVKTSKTIQVDVFSSFSDRETENMLSGPDVGNSKKWYWAANEASHVGLGPVEDDYGNGEFAYPAWWNISAWDKQKSCMYDNEFVFTRTADGITFEQTAGPAFVPGAYASVLGVDGDACYDETVATTMFGVKQVSFAPSSSKAALEGTWDNEAYKGTSFTLSDGGFMGWFIGASTYDIVSITSEKLIVRIEQKERGFAWYQTFVSSKPSQGPNYVHTNLVWEDDFNTDGAPDATKWTYDIGKGTNGWGNNELQHYTDRSDNVKVQNGNLIITAKKESFSGSDYTSARIKSQGLYAFTYGRVEVRAKLPAEAGTWPAFWMLGADFPTVGWPKSGEIDIMEQNGANKSNVLGTVHWFDSGSPNNHASDGGNTAVSNVDSEYHLYTVEWTAEKIKIFLDDEMYYEFDNNNTLPFNKDFFLIMNVAMGGTLGGTVDASFTDATMEV
ncbi:MAG: glycoside hydrolase family 16 protein, partial [Flavobacteriaceae bacterium]|nr:glycoside hydrolase family 16 protein [Flavobacteriaceae bacterium]